MQARELLNNEMVKQKPVVINCVTTNEIMQKIVNDNAVKIYDRSGELVNLTQDKFNEIELELVKGNLVREIIEGLAKIDDKSALQQIYHTVLRHTKGD